MIALGGSLRSQLRAKLFDFYRVLNLEICVLTSSILCEAQVIMGHFNRLGLYSFHTPKIKSQDEVYKEIHILHVVSLCERSEPLVC